MLYNIMSLILIETMFENGKVEEVRIITEVIKNEYK